MRSSNEGIGNQNPHGRKTQQSQNGLQQENQTGQNQNRSQSESKP
ncbi:MAG TPA: hypothetical protein VFW30_07625 [Bryocella sp.]|nr:hypothetical protein [Bryocella sp.]